MASRGIAEVLTGAVVLAVAVGFLGFAVAHSGRSTGVGYVLTAKFDHIDGLAVGADVRIAGVKVGTVAEERIDPETYLAVVDMKLREDIKVPKDSSAEITSERLLGGKFLTLTPGGDPTMLKPGQVITITQSSVSLEQLLGKFIFSATSLSNVPKPGAPAGDPKAGEAK